MALTALVLLDLVPSRTSGVYRFVKFESILALLNGRQEHVIGHVMYPRRMKFHQYDFALIGYKSYDSYVAVALGVDCTKQYCDLSLGMVSFVAELAPILVFLDFSTDSQFGIEEDSIEYLVAKCFRYVY